MVRGIIHPETGVNLNGVRILAANGRQVGDSSLFKPVRQSGLVVTGENPYRPDTWRFAGNSSLMGLGEESATIHSEASDRMEQNSIAQPVTWTAIPAGLLAGTLHVWHYEELPKISSQPGLGLRQRRLFWQ